MTRLCGFIIATCATASIALGAGVSVDWMDHAPPTTQCGVSFGVPWPRGAIAKGQPLKAESAKRQAVAMQSWPMAYWPDGR